jgi:4-hydroxy-tetrahydrodipicolinate synthase
MPNLRAELIPAMVTPFNKDYSIDFEKAEKLAVYLVNNGCDGILVNGTTGESPTLSFDEKVELLKVVKSAVRDKDVQIVAGIGSNDTHKSVEEARKIAAIGVDALLVVVPYYNKPSQRGMIEHFRQVAQAVETEIIIYNIPSRCVVLMSADTMATLHRECPNIIGVKQSHPDMDAVSEITAKLPSDTWRTWCGDDSLTMPMMACGAYGTISVLAHLTGPMMREMIQAFKHRDLDRALQLHVKQLNLAKDIFFLPNPTVIKTCLARLGMMGPTLRPPMVAPDEQEMGRIEQILKEYKALMPQGVS